MCCLYPRTCCGVLRLPAQLLGVAPLKRTPLQPWPCHQGTSGSPSSRISCGNCICTISTRSQKTATFGSTNMSFLSKAVRYEDHNHDDGMSSFSSPTASNIFKIRKSCDFGLQNMHYYITNLLNLKPIPGIRNNHVTQNNKLHQNPRKLARTQSSSCQSYSRLRVPAQELLQGLKSTTCSDSLSSKQLGKCSIKRSVSTMELSSPSPVSTVEPEASMRRTSSLSDLKVCTHAHAHI